MRRRGEYQAERLLLREEGLAGLQGRGMCRNACERCTARLVASQGLYEQQTDGLRQMESFKQCWKQQGNNARTDAKDA